MFQHQNNLGSNFNQIIDDKYPKYNWCNHTSYHKVKISENNFSYLNNEKMFCFNDAGDNSFSHISMFLF